MNSKSPISALQELMDARKLPLPIYREESEGFTFKCTVEAGGVTEIGFGPNKKSAKHDSAKNCIEKLKSTHPSHRTQILILEKSAPPLINNNSILQRNYIGDLNEFCSKNGVDYPKYEDGYGFSLTSNTFHIKCSFLGKEVIGSGNNKKEAKQDAARKMLDIIKSSDSVTLVQEYRQTIIQQPLSTIISAPKFNEILSVYNKLSINTDPILIRTNNVTLDPSPDIQLTEDDTLEVLQSKLNSYKVKYLLREIQRGPWIIQAKIDGTDLCFLGGGNSKEEATRKVLKVLLQVKKDGCSLNNDLIDLN